MKFIIKPSEISPMLSTVLMAADRRNIETPLSNVKIVAANGRLSVQTCNLDSNMIASTAAVQIVEPGRVMVSASVLAEIIQRSVCETVSVELAKGTNQLAIASDDGTAKLYTAPPEQDLPAMPSPEGSSLKLNAADLAEAMNRVSFCAGKESVGSAIRGIGMLPGKSLRLACVDGRRAVIDTLTGEFKADRPAVLPLSVSAVLAKVLAVAGDSDAELHLAENRIVLVCGDYQYATALLEVSFPPVDDVVPREAEFEGNISVAGLLACIDRVSVFVSEESKAVRIDLKDGRLTLSAQHPTRGEGSASTTCGIKGAITIGVNPQLLLPYLKTCDSDFVDVGMISHNRPIRMRDAKRTFVLMPVNLNR